MPTADPVIYLKKSLKSLWNKPRLRNLFSLIRFYPAWRKHLRPGRNSVDDQTPWISFNAIEFLKKIVRPDMCVFEYGSGGSTMFWISRVQELVSVEHDRSWYSILEEKLDRLSVQNIQYILAEADADPRFFEKDFKNPGHYISSDPGYAGKNFERYAKSIDVYPDQYFDIIVVDGRARPSCIQQGLPKLKKNGWLIIDNTERRYYMAPFSFDRNSWKISIFAGPVPYVRDFSQTSFLKKLI
jgi:hypothetical protein